MTERDGWVGDGMAVIASGACLGSAPAVAPGACRVRPRSMYPLGRGHVSKPLGPRGQDPSCRVVLPGVHVPVTERSTCGYGRQSVILR